MKIYMGAGAILVLGRDLVMVPKLIHPLPPQTPRSPKLQNGGDDIEEEPPTPHPVNDTWMQVRSLSAGAAWTWRRKCPIFQASTAPPPPPSQNPNLTLARCFSCCSEHSASGTESW